MSPAHAEFNSRASLKKQWTLNVQLMAFWGNTLVLFTRVILELFTEMLL